ncbi:MAG: HD domain-containing protein, partial [Candidatus Omnitrophota bacterium]
MNFKKHLKVIPYLSVISSIAKKKNIDLWLVGGFLRDVYLKKKKELIDFDFCVEKDVFSVARAFARGVSSKLIILDRDQGSYRVILKRKNKIFTYDFTLMRGADFCQDLSLRDFSANTLAVKLNDPKYRLLDFFGARANLNKKVIRFIKEEVLFHDPLRILRGFSFMANYDFRIDTETAAAMVKYKCFLKNVSLERISEELFKIFAARNSCSAVKRMSDLKIIDEVIAYISESRGVVGGPYHHLDVWNHSLETLYKFEQLWRRKLSKNKDIYQYFNEELAVGRRRIQILKLACLLHDVGKPRAKKRVNKKTIFHTHEKIGRDLAEKIAQNLRLSFREKEFLKKLIFWHLRPGYLADQVEPSKRAIYRFFRDTAEDGVAVIVLSLSDWRATRGPLIDTKKRKKHENVMFHLIDLHFKEQKKQPLSQIVDGYDVMRKFKIKPSPLIGKILRKVKEEQMLGNVKTKAQAYGIAKKIIELGARV